MVRLRKHVKMGVHWLNCGWRLFHRNPWLLVGMGCVSILIIILLTLVPFIGSLTIPFIAPILMSSAMLVVDELSKQKIALPPSLRVAAFARSPKELFRAIGNDQHIMAMLLMGIYALAVALLINISAHLISGGAWASDLLGLDATTLLKALATWLVIFLLYLVLAVSLIFAVPLVFLQNEAVVPALGHSLHAGSQYIIDLLVIIGLGFAPFALGAIVSPLSILITYMIWFIGGALALPIFITSCYCSYRTIFPTE